MSRSTADRPTPVETLVATGPDDFVAWLVERWATRGARVDRATGQLVTIGARPRVLETPDERAALREAGLYDLAPAKRGEWRRWYLVESPPTTPPGDARVTPARETRRRRARARPPSADEPLLGLDT